MEDIADRAGVGERERTLYRLVGPKENEIELGSRFRLRRRGRIHEGVWEITSIDRPHSVSLTARTDWDQSGIPEAMKAVESPD